MREREGMRESVDAWRGSGCEKGRVCVCVGWGEKREEEMVRCIYKNSNSRHLRRMFDGLGQHFRTGRMQREAAERVVATSLERDRGGRGTGRTPIDLAHICHLTPVEFLRIPKGHFRGVSLDDLASRRSGTGYSGGVPQSMVSFALPLGAVCSWNSLRRVSILTWPYSDILLMPQFARS